MNRIAGLVFALFFALPACSSEGDAAAGAAPAPRTDIVEGKHYRRLTPAQPTSSSPDKVEVAEVFMYSCPHCYSLEPFIAEYLADKPANVSFVRIPASFNSMAALHSKAFFAAEVLGILDEVHEEFFREFHVERNRLSREKDIIDFFVEHGVERDRAEQTLRSFPVDTMLRRSRDLSRRYGIDSVPSLVVNGMFVTSGSMTGSAAKLRETLDYLVDLAAAQPVASN